MAELVNGNKLIVPVLSFKKFLLFMKVFTGNLWRIICQFPPKELTDYTIINFKYCQDPGVSIRLYMGAEVI